MGLSEADTRVKLIDPALASAGWGEDRIRREVQITNGRLFLVGNETHRRQPTFADYLLYSDDVPVAVVEAKDDSHEPADGLQQAKAYAERLDLKFAYSSNGKAFTEFDYLTNIEAELPIDAFPTLDTLLGRLHAGGDTAVASDPMRYPYNTSRGMYPRYYQDVAIRRSIAAIERGDKRLLLALATGTGKTYIAAQLVWKLYSTKRVRRVLFLADRVFLRDQAYNDFGFFKGDAGDPRYAIEGAITEHSDIYFGIYQSLYAQQDDKKLYESLPRDFFDLVIIDECHRSGFGTWRDILDYFDSAVQLGLTATPKRTDNIDTYAYFGDPVYSYSLGQGIDDGFLATYKVHRVRTNLDKQGGVDIADAVIAGAELFVPDGALGIKDFYSVGEFEQTIILPDWTSRICDHLAALLQSSDPLDKTIVFCVNMDHAATVRRELQNKFAHLGIADYAVRIVSEEPYAATMLERFRDPYRRSPILVTTVDLLSTGVNVPSVRNIVFMKPIGSTVVFKQIVGRGTRLDPVTGKTWFRVVDYTNATRHFDDWDRPLDEPTELAAKPWEGVIRIQVVDAETIDPVPGAYAIAVAAPNEQVQLMPTGDELRAEVLPEATVTVQVGAPEYRGRRVKLPAVKAAEAQLAIVELRTDKPIAERIELRGLSVDVADEVILTVDATGRQMTVDEYMQYASEVVLTRVPTAPALRALWLNPEARRTLLDDVEENGVHPTLLADLDGVPDADEYDALSHVAFASPLVARSDRRVRFTTYNSTWLNSLPVDRREVADELLETYVDGGVQQLQRSVLRLDRFAGLGGAVGVLRRFDGTAAFDEFLSQFTERMYPAPQEIAA